MSNAKFSVHGSNKINILRECIFGQLRKKETNYTWLIFIAVTTCTSDLHIVWRCQSVHQNNADFLPSFKETNKRQMKTENKKKKRKTKEIENKKIHF